MDNGVVQNMVDIHIYHARLESYIWERTEKTRIFSGLWRHHSVSGSHQKGLLFFLFNTQFLSIFHKLPLSCPNLRT